MVGVFHVYSRSAQQPRSNLAGGQIPYKTTYISDTTVVRVVVAVHNKQCREMTNNLFVATKVQSNLVQFRGSRVPSKESRSIPSNPVVAGSRPGEYTVVVDSRTFNPIESRRGWIQYGISRWVFRGG